ncbi:MAG: hypothetical protein V4723_22245 [Pseudomonadota bacterium]
MHSHHLSLSFRIETKDTLATLETVFATARRGNVALAGLQLRHPDAEHEIVMDVTAHESEWLDLFLARLHNIIGVHDCRVAPAAAWARVA